MWERDWAEGLYFPSQRLRRCKGLWLVVGDIWFRGWGGFLLGWRVVLLGDF